MQCDVNSRQGEAQALNLKTGGNLYMECSGVKGVGILCTMLRYRLSIVLLDSSNNASE